jgi:formylglycine-generating enzyme required for sulfatase activity
MMVRIVFVLLLCLLLPSPAVAEKRVALVIGIDKYDNLGPSAQLRKARSDAAAVARVLRDLGFDVIAKEDVTRSAFNGHWQDFLNKLTPGDTAAFYFAGHGVEFGGRSYLLPRDVPNLKPGRDELLRREALSLQEFLADLREKGARLNLVILDACRDNPFEQVAGRSVGSRRGLAVTEPPPEGTFIMYSAGAGESALDRLDDADGDPNSVYTRNLLPLLKTRGSTLTEVAEQVRVAVRQIAATVQHRQTPAYYNQVLGRVCLAGGECGARVAGHEAAEAWDRTKDTTSIAALEAFIRRFGETYYGDLAKVRLAELMRAETAKKNVEEAQAKRASEEAERQRLALLKAEQDRAAEGAKRKAEADLLRPGRVFRDCPECPEMVVVPAGKFMMGSSPSEIAALQKEEPNHPSHIAYEGPQHRVSIARPFAVGKFEVTFAEWDACGAGSGCQSNRRPDDMGWGTMPVVMVSWVEAKEYVAWLSQRTGKIYRLLTEAEWEYVARAGSTTRYPWGDEFEKAYARLIPTRGKVRDRRLVPVGTNLPNAFGLHDIIGNAGELVEDIWHDSYHEAPSDGSAWLKPTGASHDKVVCRNGSYWPMFSRSAARTWCYANRRDLHTGFRVALSL